MRKVERNMVENKEVVISLTEAKKRKYAIDDEYDEKSIIFLCPTCNPNPEYVEYIKQQWENVGKENKKPKKDRKATVLLGSGPYIFSCNKWVINTNDFTNDFAMVLFDGKNKPFVLQGMVDCLKVGTSCEKKWPKTIEDIEKLKQKYLISNGGIKETSKEREEAEKILDCSDFEGSGVNAFFSYWNDVKDGVKYLYHFSSKSIYATNVVAVYKAILAEKMHNWRILKSLSRKLASIFPEYAEYWNNKTEIADKKIKEELTELLNNGFDRENLKKELLKESIAVLERLNSHEREDGETAFHTLVFDCNAVYGNMLISLDTIGNYEQTTKECDEEERLEYRYSAAEFDYINCGEINVIDDIAMNECFEDIDEGIDIFMTMVTEVLFELMNSEAYKKLWKTPDFEVICMDHGDYEKAVMQMSVVKEYAIK